MPTIELKDLVQVTHQNRVQRIELIGGGADTQVQRLYDAMVAGKFKSDEEYAAYLFGDNPRRISYLHRVERKLKEQLYNTVMFVDFDNKIDTEAKRIYYQCIKNYATFMVLLGRNGRKSAIPLAKKTIEMAKSLADHTELIFLLLKQLCEHYGSLGNNQKYARYNREMDKYLQLVQLELMLEKYYQNYKLTKSKSRTAQLAMMDTLKEQEKQLRPLLKEHKSYKIVTIGHLIIINRYTICSDYEKVLELCDEAIAALYSSTKLPRATALYQFNRIKLDAFTKLRRDKEGEKAIKACLEHTKPGGSNWYNTHFYANLYYLYTGQYQKAYKNHEELVIKTGFKETVSISIVSWQLMEGYLQYLLEIGRIADSEKQHKRFRINKLMNESPIFSRDKRGYNVCLLILQILFYLKRKQHGEVLDKMESLNMYCHRYLRKGEMFRSNCFIKMLLEIPKGYFNRKVAVRKAQRYIDKLNSAPKLLSSADFEIIPYELLWEYALDSLDA